jgi:undecaprenyl-diphosphatase
VAQALALIPGVSRSGATMTAALLLDFRRDAAARFSFLLSTPIIAGAALIEGLSLARNGLPPGMETPFLVGVLVSAVSGYLCIAWFLRFLQFGTFKIFVYYRIILGIIVLALALFTDWGSVA